MRITTSPAGKGAAAPGSRPLPEGMHPVPRTVYLALLGKMLHRCGVRLLDNCRMGGIGHLAMEPAWFLVKQRLGRNRDFGRFFVLLLPERSAPANPCLLDLWRRAFLVFDQREVNDFLRHVGRAYPPLRIDIGLAPENDGRIDAAFTRERNIRHARMIEDVQEHRHRFGRRLLDLPPAIIDQGRKRLADLGIGADDWFVCLHASEVSLNGLYGYDLSRRQRIEDYRALIDDIHARGGKVVRMGDSNLPPAPVELPVIDYPRSTCKSDWMDLVLIHECRYFIGCQSGLQLVAVLFGKSQLLTNCVNWFQVCVFDGDRYLPKLYRCERRKRYLSLREYVERGLPLVHTDPPPPLLAESNGGDDLVAAVRELEAILAGQAEDEPRYLRTLWRNALCWQDFGQRGDGEVCGSFLEKYRKILFSCQR